MQDFHSIYVSKVNSDPSPSWQRCKVTSEIIGAVLTARALEPLSPKDSGSVVNRFVHYALRAFLAARGPSTSLKKCSPLHFFTPVPMF